MGGEGSWALQLPVTLDTEAWRQIRNTCPLSREDSLYLIHVGGQCPLLQLPSLLCADSKAIGQWVCC